MVNYHETVGAARALRYEAAVRFRRENNIRMALRYFSMRPEGLRLRVSEFEAVCLDLGSLVEARSPLDPMLYKNVAELKNALGGKVATAPRTLIEAVYIYEELHKEEKQGETKRTINAFETINQKMGSSEWAFARQLTDPNKLASRLLIEGYGIFIEKLDNYPEENGVAKTVSLACMEVLFLHYPDSVLLEDVLDWMKEEKADFGPGAQARLENM